MNISNYINVIKNVKITEVKLIVITNNTVKAKLT